MWLRRPHKKVVPSPVGDVKIVSPISAFVLNTLTLKYSAFIFCTLIFLRNQGRLCHCFLSSKSERKIIISMNSKWANNILVSVKSVFQALVTFSCSVSYLACESAPCWFFGHRWQNIFPKISILQRWIISFSLLSSISCSKHWYWSSCQTESTFHRILAVPSSADFSNTETCTLILRL